MHEKFCSGRKKCFYEYSYFIIICSSSETLSFPCPNFSGFKLQNDQNYLKFSVIRFFPGVNTMPIYMYLYSTSSISLAKIGFRFIRYKGLSFMFKNGPIEYWSLGCVPSLTFTEVKTRYTDLCQLSFLVLVHMSTHFQDVWPLTEQLVYSGITHMQNHRNIILSVRRVWFTAVTSIARGQKSVSHECSLLWVREASRAAFSKLSIPICFYGTGIVRGAPIIS